MVHECDDADGPFDTKKNGLDFLPKNGLDYDANFLFFLMN